MKRIELEIVADNSNYIQSAKQVEQATQSMHNKAAQGQKREKGLIEDTIDSIRQLEEKRRKAYSVEGVEKYNKKLAEARQTLKEYNEAGLKADKAQKSVASSTNNMWNAFKRLLGPILTVTAAIKAFNLIMGATQQTGDALKREITGLKFAADELWRSIASGNMEDLTKRMKEAASVGREYAVMQDNIGDRIRELEVRESERGIELAKLAKIYRNTALTGVEGYNKQKDAAEAYIKLAEEGEKETLELLNLRLEAELSVARQAMGLTEEYRKANEEDKKRINDQIIANIKGQRQFEQYGEAIRKYGQLLDDLAFAEQGVIEQRLVGDEMIQVRGAKDLEAIKKINEAISQTPEDVKKIYQEYQRWGKVLDPERTKITQALTAINDKQKEVETQTIRASVRMELANKNLANLEEKSLEERTKQYEEFLKGLEALYDDYEKTRIEQLTGIEQIKAIEAFAIQTIDKEQKRLETLGTLNADALAKLQGLRDYAHQQALASEAEFNRKQIEEQMAALEEHIKVRQDINDLERDIELQALEITGKDTESARLEIEKRFYQRKIALINTLLTQESDVTKQRILQKQKELLEGAITALDQQITASRFNFWDAIGISDPDQQEKIKEDLRTIVDSVAGALDEIYSQRVADAERTRSLLDDQIADTQNALEAEMDLMKAGFASNVDAKRKELEQLKVEREKALKEEEKAIKKQQALDTTMQVTSLITAAANIFKGYSSLPIIGQVLAIAAVASMFAAFAAVKIQAKNATKLAKGAVGTDTGIINGRSHAEGGEKFTDHIEVERGEMWGVLSKDATRKHGRQFTEIVNNFNRDNLTIDRNPINNVMVDISQANERLDKVEYQLIRLNNHFGGQVSIQDFPNVRIEKRGNKTRIIRK